MDGNLPEVVPASGHVPWFRSTSGQLDDSACAMPLYAAMAGVAKHGSWNGPVPGPKVPRLD